MKEINIPGRLLRDIVTFAKKNDISKITLFGSRARGTHFEKSDVDIAVEGGNFDSFYQDIQSKAHSLLEFDIVKYDDTTSDELKEEIIKDGVVIYEKN
jgi:predicted nucleotidyltransferase